jgi:hypothetical protein
MAIEQSLGSQRPRQSALPKPIPLFASVVARIEWFRYTTRSKNRFDFLSRKTLIMAAVFARKSFGTFGMRRNIVMIEVMIDTDKKAIFSVCASPYVVAQHRSLIRSC